jgi:inner membrane protein COX18
VCNTMVCNMLASRTATGNVRAAFLQLPSHLRLLSHQQSSRSFSATAPTKISMAEIVATPSLVILNGLHAVGIPWYAVLPTAAILIRGVFGYYFAVAPARRRAQIRSNLNPLIAAELQLDSSFRALKGQEPVPPGLKGFTTQMKAHSIGKRFGAGVIASTSFVNFVALITTAEAVRMKCGARQGLLSTLLTPFEWLARTFAPGYSSTLIDAAEVRAQELAKRLEHLRETRIQQAQEQGLSPEAADAAASGQSLVSDNLYQYSPQAPPLIDTNSPYMDVTLQTEGFSWCTDLTAIDPYGILPNLTCAIMLGRILIMPLPTPRPRYVAQKLPAPLKFLATRYSDMQYFSAAFALLLGYVLQSMPAAISLYMLSTVVAGSLQQKWLSLAMPMRKQILQCSRGPRIMSKKQWSARQ